MQLNNTDDVTKIAARVRYTYDEECIASSIEEASEYESNEFKNHLYSNELLISENVTPDLHSAIVRVVGRLNSPSIAISAFVFASPEINAFCVPEGNNGCVVRFSSGLIDILNTDEFEFVIGHELGHYLFKHFGTSILTSEKDLEVLIKLRSQEISADRIGLLACKSLPVAIRAILKTVSGLNDRHLRFDVAKYISQLAEVSDESFSSMQQTHPSMLVRCRALLWFSISHTYLDVNDYNGNDLETLDERVKLDMDRYVDASSLAVIEYAKHRMAMWLASYSIIQDEKFSKIEQGKFESEFGKSALDNLINIATKLDRQAADDLIYHQLKKCRDTLEQLIPASFEDEMLKLSWK